MTIRLIGRGFGKTRALLMHAHNLGAHDAVEAAASRATQVEAWKFVLVCDVRGSTAEMTRKLQAAYVAGAKEALGEWVTVKTPSGDVLCD